MLHIAVISLKGGTGRTTFAANLGRLLAERARVLMVDADPQNSLGLLFGMPVGEAAGLSTPEFQHHALVAMLRAQKAEVPYIPFGHQSQTVVAAVESQLRLDPTWLDKRLRELAPATFDYTVIDTPAQRSVWFTQAMAIANIAIVVIEACALSYTTLPEIDAILDDARKRPGFKGAMFVVNRLDSRRALSRDVRAALSQSVGEHLVDAALVDDEHVREAAALRTTCVQMAPHSQFATALRDIAGRVLEMARS